MTGNYISSIRNKQIATIFKDAGLIERLLQEAQNSPRLRSHYNLHNSYDDPVQRLLIAFRKGTYVRPHYHLQPNKWELMEEAGVGDVYC